MKKSSQSGKFGLVFIGIVAAGLYYFFESVGPGKVGLSVYLNISVLIAVSVFSQTLINRSQHDRDQLAEINKNLENSVRERTAELEESNKQLKEEIAIRNLTEELLKESEDKYRTIFENTGTATIIINENRTISLANNAFISISGYEMDELKGLKSWTEFFHKNYVGRILDFHRESMTSSEAALRNYVCQFVDRHRNAKHVLLTVVVIPNTRQLLATIFDISEMKQALELIEKIDLKEPVAQEEAPDMASELSMAYDQGRIKIFYQPIIRCDNKNIIGFEALMRWDHPQKGLLLPEYFLGSLEETGLIIELGTLLIQDVCQQIRQWQDNLESNIPLAAFINLSPQQLMKPDFLNNVKKIIDDAGLDPRQIKFELPERVVTDGPEAFKTVFEQFQDIGIQIGLDDIRVDQTLDRILKEVPVDFIKIDGFHLSGAGEAEQEQKKKIEDIIETANSSGVFVVAEGVESAEQQKLFSEWKCRYAQGFLFAKPMDISMVDQIIQKRKKARNQGN